MFSNIEKSDKKRATLELSKHKTTADSTSNRPTRFETTTELNDFRLIFDRIKYYLSVSRSCNQSNLDHKPSGSTSSIYYHIYNAYQLFINNVEKIIQQYNSSESPNNKAHDVGVFISSINKIIDKDHPNYDDQFISLFPQIAAFTLKTDNLLTGAEFTDFNHRDLFPVQLSRHDIAFFDRLVITYAAEYLRFTFTKDMKESLRKKAEQDNNPKSRAQLLEYAEGYQDEKVCAMLPCQIAEHCQVLLSQLEYFAFSLLESKQRSSDLSKLVKYDQSTNASAHLQLGLLSIDTNGQWAFLNDGFLHYFAARYIGSCLFNALPATGATDLYVPRVSYPKIRDITPNKHLWVCDRTLSDYISLHAHEPVNQIVWTYAGSMLGLGTEDDSLRFFHRVARKQIQGDTKLLAHSFFNLRLEQLEAQKKKLAEESSTLNI